MKMLVRVYHRRCSLMLACVATALPLIAGGAASAQPVTSRLLARDHIARLGLTRAWFAQVQLDSGRSRVERAILSGDQMFVLTSAGTLHALNALTGETMWVAPFGNPGLPSMGPAANERRVAVVNGLTLYVLDRVDGRPAIVRRVGGVPAAAPAMSRAYCFVPMVTGRVEGYPVEDEKLAPWYFQSQGRAMVAPLITGSSVVWSTDSGHIYVGNATAPGVRFRLETGSEIVAPPASRGPTIYVGTVAGELIAVDEMTAAQPWRFASGYSILRAPATVGGRIYVPSTQPA
ncbi:MAG: PQQ-binding-like beta-propeller repeat protein, partial [Pirellulales bacterium]